MATKTISFETDAYALKDPTESFSHVIRCLFAERPALTGSEILDVIQEFKYKGAGPRRNRS